MDDFDLNQLDNLTSFTTTFVESVVSGTKFLDKYHPSTTTIERPLTAGKHNGESYTYSFQETTFARRLHRMCLERAYRNLTNPHMDREYIDRVFKFTFCYANRSRVIRVFQELLKRRAGESLENWNAPFFHLGGAGTHFPRRNQAGEPVFPPNMVSPAKAFGPRPWIPPATPMFDTSYEDMLEKLGFGGEWYDSHDVEEYLKTKGVFLDGQSSFVEVDSSVLLLLDAPATGTGTSTSMSGSGSSLSPLDAIARTPSPMLGGGITHSFSIPELDGITSNQNHFQYHTTHQVPSSQSAFFSPTMSTDLTPPTSDRQDTLFPPSLTWPHTPSWSSDFGHATPGTMTFDIDSFLERMVDGSVCLGRAPGFRRGLVDDALRRSLSQDVF
jgi:hypothetical protein